MADREPPLTISQRRQRQAALDALCTAPPEALPTLFADNFRRNGVLKKQIAEIVSKRKRLGPCQRATLRPPDSFMLHHRDRRQLGTIYLDNAGKIVGLWYSAMLPTTDSLEAVAAALQKLPGLVAVVVRHTTGPPLLAVHADTPLAVASTFKLYVLKALLAEVSAGHLRWDQVVRLKRGRLIPGQFLVGKLGAGHPMTLRTLAFLMMMLSDNSATDHLLHLLGRLRVEHVAGARNMPLLSTLEMFKLQDARNRRLAEAYIKANVAERRRLLETLARRPDHGFRRGDKPAHLAPLEWFYTTNELCRVMLELKDQPLAHNRRSPARDFSEFDRVAFKGGFEPGVRNFTFAIRHAATRRWTCVSITYNARPGAPRRVQRRFRRLTVRLLHALADHLGKSAPRRSRRGND